jgi:hypothetical protein
MYPRQQISADVACGFCFATAPGNSTECMSMQCTVTRPCWHHAAAQNVKLLCGVAAETVTTRSSQANDAEAGSKQAAAAAAAAAPAWAASGLSALRFNNLPLWRSEWPVLPGCQVGRQGW